MSAQTSDQTFPTPCKRCGGVLYQHVDFCPYCGADHPLQPIVRKRPEPALKAISSPTAHAPVAQAPVAPVQASSAPLMLPTMSDIPPVMPEDRQIPPLNLPAPMWQTAGRWIFTKGLLLVWFILALGYAAYLLLGDNRKQEIVSEETTANTSGGSISPYTPQAQSGGAPSATDANAPPVVNPPLRPMPTFKDLPDALRAARASLQDNNLSGAKAAVAAALSMDADNGDARTIQRDIASREQRRDTELQAGSACEKDHQWACVRQHASDALAIDTSSPTAQAMLERVIVSTGWRPLAPIARPGGAEAPTPRGGSVAAPPGPGNPATARAMPQTAMPATATTAPATDAASAPAAAAGGAVSGAVTAAPAAPGAASSANDSSSIDAQERAIRESGWKHPASSAAAH
jgi:hypothetical protein